jgi:uncharacterized protein (TIGR03382 family)
VPEPREKRRLPVVGSAPDSGGVASGDKPRPAWQWVGFGTVGVFAAWLPLAIVAQRVALAIAARWLGPGATEEALLGRFGELAAADRTKVLLALALPHVAALAGGAASGGYLVGRWGAPGTGAREAALSGFAAGGIASLLSCASGGVSVAPLLVLLVATAFAALGGRRGFRRRSG